MASLSTCHLGLWLGWQIVLNQHVTVGHPPSSYPYIVHPSGAFYPKLLALAPVEIRIIRYMESLAMFRHVLFYSHFVKDKIFLIIYLFDDIRVRNNIGVSAVFDKSSEMIKYFIQSSMTKWVTHY